MASSGGKIVESAIGVSGSKFTGLAAPSASGDALSQNSVVPSSDGSVSAPGHTFSTDPATGLYKIGAGDIGIAASGVIAAEVKATGTANATTYNPLTVYGATSNKSTRIEKQVTTGITTSAVTIYTLGGDASLVMVYGKQTAGGTTEFFDIVAVANNGTTAVLASISAAGSPPARTYSGASTVLKVLFASGTFTVTVSAIGMQG